MPKTISLAPVTRLEGHLSVRITLENNRVASAFSAGEMFRGFEVLLRGRDPLDAQQITQRICGVCPVSHGIASSLAQEEAYGIRLTSNGTLLRNLMQAANYLQSHIIHFYHLSAVDFIDINAVQEYKGSDSTLLAVRRWVQEQVSSKTVYPAAPFLPRLEGSYAANKELNLTALRHYCDAFEYRELAHRVVATFGGKAPHLTALVPGGTTQSVTAGNMASVRSLLLKLKTFIDECYLSDVLAVAQTFREYFSVGAGSGDYLSYGAFPSLSGDALFTRGVLRRSKAETFDPAQINEQVRYSFYASDSGLHPFKGETRPQPRGKDEAYSWLKAPRYDATPLEVGPLARVLITYASGSQPDLNRIADSVLSQLGVTATALNSVLGRHACRAIEAKFLVDKCLEWVDELKPGQPTAVPFKVPKTGSGAGLWEAPRGALGHWLEIDGHLIKNYQCVVPTTWNCSPRDDSGAPGPLEAALVGTPVADEANPLEVARVIRSFDPCLACAVH